MAPTFVEGFIVWATRPIHCLGRRPKLRCPAQLHGAMMSELATIGTYSVFIASYVVFALGKFPGMKIDRPGAAIIGAVLMFTFGSVHAHDALHFIHFGTVVLLFSMMLVVAHLHLAGFFDWITDLVVTRLKPRHLLPTVIFLSGLLSAFFVNDIICLVMVPFVLKATAEWESNQYPIS